MDLHHFPFAHRPFAPSVPRLDPYEVRAVDDVISFHGRLRREDGPRDRGGLAIAMEVRFPGTLVANIGGVTVTGLFAPIDETRTSLVFRYTSLAPVIGKLIAWLAAESEVRLVQPADQRMVEAAGPSYDSAANSYVPSDRAFLLWLKRWRAQATGPLVHQQASGMRESK